MYDLIYVSTAKGSPSNDDLKKLLTRARERNSELGITGLLAYDQETRSYVQILEGPKDSVLKVFDIIRNDRGHENIRVLKEGDSKSRRFGDWTMAMVESAYFKSIVFEYL